MGLVTTMPSSRRATSGERSKPRPEPAGARAALTIRTHSRRAARISTGKKLSRWAELAINRLRAGGRPAKNRPVGHRGDRLTARERESLDRDGYLVVPALLDEPVIRPLLTRLAA